MQWPKDCREWTGLALLWLVLSLFSRLIWELFKDAVAGKINDHFGEQWEMINPALKDALLFTWLPPIVFALAIGAGLLLAYRIGGGRPTAKREISHQSDPEIIQMRNDVLQLRDALSDFGLPEYQRDNVYERVDRIKNSDHSVWLDNENLRIARKNFVHWCKVAQAWREKYGVNFRDADEKNETLHYLNDAAERLDAGLKGKPVRSQQPYNRSEGHDGTR